ncbi:MAG: glycosyltransferase [Cyanobacteria bacterium P01_F01_bin.143]
MTTISSSRSCPVSVVIPTFNRSNILVNTLKQILKCDPLPDEIIVHIDGNDIQSENIVRDNFKNVKIIKSDQNIGPGGGRNRLITIAKNEIVASFDDDSYPYDFDYFGRLIKIFNSYPEASIIATAIYDQNRPIQEAIKKASWTASFVGCGCAYKKSDFLKTDGYLKLPLAYGAEESDLAIQLYAKGRKILQTEWLRVYHNTSYNHHKNTNINAASIANIALLAFIRYPWFIWGKTLLQIGNRIIYAIRNKRYSGILLGLSYIPQQMWLYRNYRDPTSLSVIKQYFQLRKNPQPVTWQN